MRFSTKVSRYLVAAAAVFLFLSPAGLLAAKAKEKEKAAPKASPPRRWT